MVVESKVERFKQGLRSLTPAQILSAQMTGHIGTMVGTCCVFVVLALRGFWPVYILFPFILLLQGSGAVRTWQQLCNARESDRRTDSIDDAVVPDTVFSDIDKDRSDELDDEVNRWQDG